MKRNNGLFMQVAFILAILTGTLACKKYKDPVKPDIGDGLDSFHYCNNPLAVNFNWGFPGIPDSTVCIFPVDKFTGTWVFNDSVYTPDETLQEVVIKTLVFTATEDTLLTHLAVTGWCAGPEKMLVTADKYGRALTDTLLEYTAGQLICSMTDTISGSFQQNINSADTMKIDMTLNSASGIRYHRGTAIRH